MGALDRSREETPLRVTKLDNGNLIIPVRGEGPGGEIVEGTEEIGPDDPRYEENLPFAVPEGQPGAIMSSRQKKPFGDQI